MKKFFSLFILGLLMLSYSCKDDDENGNEVPNPAKVEIDAISNALEEMPEMAAFTQALKQLDMTTIEGTEFTLFGVNDATLASEKKAGSTISQADLKRHMASGKFDLAKLKTLSKIKMLSGDTLNISVDGNMVAINGIVIDSMKTVGLNVIFFIHKLIPFKPAQKTIVFEVLSCNEQWSPQNNSEAFKATDATIKIFNNTSTLIATLTTDTAGRAVHSLLPDVDYSYTIEKGNQKSLYKGFVVGGLITSQAQADVLPSYPKEFTKLPGGLVLLDLNNDGRIDEKDKTEKRYINETNEKVFIVSDNFTWPTEVVKVDTITQENMSECEWLYNNAYNNFTKIDESYSTDSIRKKITPSDKLLDSLWTNSYNAIKTINKYLVIEGTGTQLQRERKAELIVWRGILHTNLTFVFGDIPIVTSSETNWNTMTRNSLGDVYKFVQDSYLATAYKDLTGVKKVHALSNSALIYLMQKNYSGALDNADYILNSGAISASNNRELYLKTIYYKLETLIELGRQAEAMTTFNQFKTITTGGQNAGMTLEQLRSESRYILNKYTISSYYGITYANISRWGENSTWGKYKLMPIPQSAITSSGGVLTQNPEW